MERNIFFLSLSSAGSEYPRYNNVEFIRRARRTETGYIRKVKTAGKIMQLRSPGKVKQVMSAAKIQKVMSAGQFK